MGHAGYICLMFIRKNKNRSGTVSIQIVQKSGRKNKVVKTVGIAKTDREEQLLMVIAKNEIEKLQGLYSLFHEHDDLVIESFVDGLSNNQLQIVGPQLVLGGIYDRIRLPSEDVDKYFKHLVISRLVYPGSKLKTIKYLQRHYGLDVSIQTIYRYLDQLDTQRQHEIQQKVFEHTKKVLRGKIGVVFYDMTTLYFEASDEDDIRKIGYSKDGKHQHPQIMLGLLVGSNGYPIGYEIFQGNTSETKTLIPVLEVFQQRFGIDKPIVVADCALLSETNIQTLKRQGYKYILGGKIKNEAQQIQEKILQLDIEPDKPAEIQNKYGRLIISYSERRAKKDAFNRQRGLKRLETKVKSGKLKKENINNRGYNKYLVLEGDVKVKIDYDKFNADQAWDGLKGYSTNTGLTPNQVIENYNNLWFIEKAFRISKTDLKVRPVYHRVLDRIQAHICICFVAYAVYKELERELISAQIGFSAEKAIEMTKDMQQITYWLPKSKQLKNKLLNLNEDQTRLLQLVKS